MGDDAAVLLGRTRQEARNVHQGHDRNVERIAEADETRGLAAGVDVEHAGHELGLVGDDADRLAVETREAGDDVLGVSGSRLQVLAVVHDRTDDLGHVVGFVGVVGDDVVERILQARDRIVADGQRSILHVVLRHVGDELADQLDALLLGIDGELRHARLGGVHRGTAQLLLRHVLARHGLYDLRAGEEHVRGLLLHDDEVGQGGRINGTAGAGAEDGRNLRDDARRHHVALEDVGIAGQRVHAFLDTRTARVVHADAGGAVAQGHVHDLADLVGHRQRQRTRRHGEVLCENIDQASVDRTVTGHYAVAEGMALVHPEVVAAVRHEHVELLEGAFVEQHLDALAGRVLTLGMLGVDTLLTASETRGFAVLDQLVDLVLNFTHKYVGL